MNYWSKASDLYNNAKRAVRNYSGKACAYSLIAATALGGCGGGGGSSSGGPLVSPPVVVSDERLALSMMAGECKEKGLELKANDGSVAVQIYDQNGGVERVIIPDLYDEEKDIYLEFDSPVDEFTQADRDAIDKYTTPGLPPHIFYTGPDTDAHIRSNVDAFIAGLGVSLYKIGENWTYECRQTPNNGKTWFLADRSVLTYAGNEVFSGQKAMRFEDDSWDDESDYTSWITADGTIVGVDWRTDGKPPYNLNQPTYFLADLYVGKVWDGIITMPPHDILTVRFEVVGEEDVAVPAGSFMSYKAKMTFKEYQDAFMLFWLSKEVPEYVKSQGYQKNNGVWEVTEETTWVAHSIP